MGGAQVRGRQPHKWISGHSTGAEDCQFDHLLSLPCGPSKKSLQSTQPPEPWAKSISLEISLLYRYWA